jgi:acyl-coenzyme A thioesterase PaaI-like protein
VRSTQPPEGATIPDPHADAPPAGTPIPSHYRWCVACGADHPAGLHLQMVTGEGLRVHGTFSVSANHQGSPGLAHGGVLATAMDEALGYLTWVVGTPAVTARLEVDYRLPVPVTSVLALEAEVIGVRGRKVYCRGSARLGGPDGPVAIEARALFLQVSIEHFLHAGDPGLIQDAIVDRAAGAPTWLADGQVIEFNP